MRTFCDLSPDCEKLLERAMLQQGLSARVHDRNPKSSPHHRTPRSHRPSPNQTHSQSHPIPHPGPHIQGLI
jgi:hypothetical protein